MDSLIVDGVNVPDSTAGFTFQNVIVSHSIRAVFARTLLHINLGVLNGWNLVSLPTSRTDDRKTILFPTATSNAFVFDGTYALKETLKNGPGYWMKFSGVQVVDLTGLPRWSDSISVSEGWNLIGSISASVSVGSVTSSPGGIVTSQFFAYAGSYLTATVIDPGKAYWVKVNQSGTLSLASAALLSASNRIRITPTSELPPSAPGGVASLMSGEVPTTFGLSQNYPNPFNPTTSIGYQTPVDGRVLLQVFDVLGRTVATVVDDYQSAGDRSVEWNAAAVPSGVYFYRLTAGSFTAVRTLVLMR